jgi:hypothetical protein
VGLRGGDGGQEFGYQLLEGAGFGVEEGARLSVSCFLPKGGILVSKITAE